jgi:hypothetical protein
LRRSDTPIVRSELITGNPKASVVKAFARLWWEGARTTLRIHPRKPSSHKPTETRDTATYVTTLMVLITKVMMVTSRAQAARSHHLSPTTRLGLRADNAWIGAAYGPQNERADVDDAATRVACITTGSGDCA